MQRFVCEITWSGGGSPAITKRFQLRSSTEGDALEELMDMGESISEPNAPQHDRIRSVLMMPATEEEWAEALDRSGERGGA
ncbi:MAG: hypothetical protein NW206_10045 [Hyphomonadaceae bacterium]|nr:hypothetical protein [Hyphomonadaceae bacterium]